MKEADEEAGPMVALQNIEIITQVSQLLRNSSVIIIVLLQFMSCCLCFVLEESFLDVI